MRSTQNGTSWRHSAVFILLASYVAIFLTAAIKEAIAARISGADTLGITFLAERWLLLVPFAALLLMPRKHLLWPRLGPGERIGLALILLMLIGTTIILSPLPARGMQALIPICAALVMIPVVAGLVSRDGSGPVADNLVMVLGVAAILAIPGAVHAHLTYGFPEYAGFIFAPGVGGLRVFGHVLAAGIAGLTGVLILASTQPRSGGLLLAVTLLWLFLGLSGSRGGVMALLASFAVLLVVSREARRKWASIILPAVIGISLSAGYDMGRPEFNVIDSFRETTTAIAAGGDPSSHRLDIWTQALDLIRDRPLLGHGYTQAHILIDWPSSPQPHVHNLILEMGLAIGVPGLLLAVALGGIWWCRATALMRAEPAALPAWLTLTTMLLLAQVSGTYLHAEGLVPIAISTGILIALAKHRRQG